MRDPVSPLPCQHSVFAQVCVLAILVGVQWYLIMAFICISPVASEVERLLMCLGATCPSSLVRSLLVLVLFCFVCFYHFQIGLFFFLLLSLENCLYIPDRSPLSDMWFMNIFSQSGACHFIVFTEDFAEWKFLILKKFQFIHFFFLLWIMLLVSFMTESSLSNPRPQWFPPFFFLKFYNFTFYIEVHDSC